MVSPRFDDTVYDDGLNELATATTVTVCSGDPANLAAVPGLALAAYTIGGPDWTVQDGASARKATLGPQTGNNGTATGAANNLAFDDAVVLQGVIDGDGDTVNNGSPVDIAQTDVLEFTAP